MKIEVKIIQYNSSEYFQEVKLREVIGCVILVFDEIREITSVR